MSVDRQQPLPVSVIGAGCAGLSLVARAADLPGHKLSLIAPKQDDADDHIWGFWAMEWLQPATSAARKQWANWQIISDDQHVLHHAVRHPYCAIHRHRWLQDCQDKAKASGVEFRHDLGLPAPTQQTLAEQTLAQQTLAEQTIAGQILDSRPPPVPDGMMLQHFVGWEVRAAAGTFDPTTAILMDFRCDQTRGMHFIYCLPFSDQEALIESTLFSPELAPADFYDAAITSYLKSICHLSAFEINRRESGVIPLGVLGRHDPGLVGIGANGGAIRPSSGYAFSFIQKQIDHAVSRAVAGKPLAVGVPHSAFELWMDRIFLAVLRRHPELAPHIFTAMAAALTGDEFARFLSGEAGMKTWAKVIMAMPKIPFLWGLLHPEAKAVS
ncbi:MAG: lycopene cyclase family protein [Candidatus Puniceispirillaceae bacterium]